MATHLGGHVGQGVALIPLREYSVRFQEERKTPNFSESFRGRLFFAIFCTNPQASMRSGSRMGRHIWFAAR